MSDPLSMISLAAAIVQFVDFGAVIIQGVREVKGSISGATERNRSVEVVVSDLRNLVLKLREPHHSQQSEDEKALGRVADECKILANQILDLLQKIKAENPKSTLHVVWAVLKNQKYKRQKLELEERLESCRNHLEFQLNYLTSAEVKTRLDTLVNSAEGLAEKFEFLRKHVEQLRCGTGVASFSPEAQEQIRKLVHLPDDVLLEIKQQRVLKSLAYSEMEARFEEVAHEHSKTFEWIFEDTTQGSRVGNDHSSRESFVDWLSSGRGIFHICGKLGSGKSTLMKFLCNHPHTERELQHWAGDRKLIFAKFFFWRGAKSVEQKSVSGLIRSLLYETLRACPELIPHVLPGLWAQAESSSWQADMKLDLGKLEARAAVSSLITLRNLYKEHCFCFFIDGLDEFEKTPQDGYGDLIRLLGSWSEAAPEAVKICVSSREDLVFMDAFSSERRFYLQDLTRGDIQRYVRETLPIAAHEQTEGLVGKITERADGIFLWVALVTKSIRDQLEEGYELSVVEEELNRLPNELQKLFGHLFETISQSPSCKTAHHTFAMVLTLRYYRLDLMVLAYSFLEHYEMNPSFAMDASSPVLHTDDAGGRSREDHARRRLYRDCRHLLEVNENEKDGSTITVTHRSILEFLESQAVKDAMKCDLDGFSAEEAISQLFLAALRHKRERFSDEFLSRVVYNIICMRDKSGIDQEPYHFLEALSAAASPIAIHDPGTCMEPQEYRRKVIYVAERAYSIVTGGLVTGGSAIGVLTSPVYVSAFVGAFQYVAWKIQRDPTIIENRSEIAVILCCIESGHVADPEDFRRRMSILEHLLTRGLSPNAIIHNSITATGYYPEDLSFWQHFVLEIGLRQFSSDEMFGKVVESFLAHDADPYVWISKGFRSLKDGTRDEGLEVTLGRERSKTISLAGVKASQYWLPPLVETGKKVSLRDMIEFWNFDNQEAILQLLDANVRRRELMANVDDVSNDQLPKDQEECVIEALDTPGLQKEPPTTSASTLRDAVAEKPAMKPWTTRDLWWLLQWSVRSHLLPFVLGILVACASPRLWTLLTTQSSMREERRGGGISEL
ncbi:P-loop containing nucleoside triphosphate hydrolase [Fonsecaea pedrosoi]|nr:P-loop containing nucleoside triphosphate hydrolase [Fonsecaea pedrosoi]